MKGALFLVAIISTALSAIETYLAYELGEIKFFKALNNAFTWIAIISTLIYLYLKY